MTRNIEKHEKWEMHTVGPGIWQEIWKSWKMKKHPLDYLKNDEITEKHEKWEMYTVGPVI